MPPTSTPISGGPDLEWGLLHCSQAHADQILIHRAPGFVSKVENVLQLSKQLNTDISPFLCLKKKKKKSFPNLPAGAVLWLFSPVRLS